jgi:transcription termination factor Rho
MSEPQLERSVLEAKEREELYAIADALGTKPGTRARKADLVAQILRATGVEVAEEPPAEKPRRTRARKAVSEPVNGDVAKADAEPSRVSRPVEPAAPDADGAARRVRRTDSSGDDISDLRSARPAADDRAEAASDAAGTNGSAVVEGPAPADPRSSVETQPVAENRQGTMPGPQGPPHTDRSRFDGEPGNRRNRRRRGRDRTDRMDRDLQGQGGEQQYSGEPIPVKGFLDLRDEGYGFLRTRGFLASPSDVYVSISQVRRFALRKGDEVEGACRPAGSNEKYPALLRIDTVSGLTPEEARSRPKFEDLTPLFPDEKMRLEMPGDPANVTARIVDLISPIGKGQRGLLVSPPKAGKTTVLKQIAHSIEANNPEVHLMVLLVDERPEEVTDMRRSVKGEVVASTFDRPSEEHTQVAELSIERAKRLVELGKDVVIVLDGITRLARAYNLAQPASGRIMSGGIDTGALYPPKKFFGSARNIEEGGSLTILATALVETGSRMDEVIFEEFKGTGNMELRLDRKLSERRIYPALDVNASSTRHEELLFDRNQLQQVWKLRRVLNALGSEGSDAAGLQLLMDKIKTTKSNDEFLAEIAKTPAPAI